MLRILCTCPPMIRSLHLLQDEFESRNAEVVVPDFSQIVPEEELIRMVGDYDGWIIGDDPATRNVFEAGRRGKLRGAVKWGVGVDNVDFEGAKEFGYQVVNTPAMFNEEVADVALAYVIMLARGLTDIDRGIRDGGWPKPVGMSLRGKTAGIVGYGNIGQAIGERLAAIGMKVVAYDPAGVSDSFAEHAAWPERLDEADFVVLTCALNKATHHILRKETLSLMKPGVFVVNISRGPLVDEEALVEALKSGHVQGAALEVFEKEPLPADSPLRGLERCIFGSHNGSNTAEAVVRASRRAMELLFNQFDPA